MMDAKYLEEIKARHEAATPGPWELSRDAGIYIDRDEDYCICGIGNEPDAEFIAHSRTDIPALLAEVERMQKELNAYKATGFTPEQISDGATVTFDVGTEGYNKAIDAVFKELYGISLVEMPTVISEYKQCATLKKALELAIEWVGRFDCPASADCKIENPVKNCDDCCGEPTSDCWYRYFIQQAQEEKK